jgi:hypothetical protein
LLVASYFLAVISELQESIIEQAAGISTCAADHKWEYRSCLLLVVCTLAGEDFMATKKKHPGTRRVTFKKADFERFAKKMEGWSTSLSPEERALLVAALNKGSQGIRKAGGGTVQTTTSVKMEADFNLGQFIVELLLALEGVSAEVDEDGPTWVEEIDTGKT